MSGELDQARIFDCAHVDEHLDALCGAAGETDYQCKLFEVNVCNISPEQQTNMCNDGFADEFFREFPCYCDDRCLTKLGTTVAGTIICVSLVIGIVCVALRRLRKPVPDEEIERRLSVARSDKPDPMVSRCSLNTFKWIPFVVCISVSLWFVISTILVIAWNGTPNVSAFEVSYMMITTAFMIFWLLDNIARVLNGARGLHLLRRELATDDPVEHTDTVHHIVVLPNFKEDIDVIRETITRLANQAYADVKQNVTIVLAMEQGEDGYWEKGEILRTEFLPFFRDVVVTCHPRLHGEQPGKSSNMKWAYAALQQFTHSAEHNKSVKQFTTQDKKEEAMTLSEDGVDYAANSGKYFEHPDLVSRTVANPDFVFDPDHTIATLMDADALSHPRFLATLGKKFEETNGPTKHMRFWQCPVAFYENIEEVDLVNRAMTIVFAFNELSNTGGLDLGLVGCNPCVPVNTYSMSWRLFDLIDGGDNFVVADESHNLFKAFHLSKGLVKLDPIYLPISVYNVTSDVWLEGFVARFTQIKRWMYGNAFEFAFWHGRYVGCSRSQNWPVPLLDKLPILWRLFIYSSFNLVMPLFFCLYGFSSFFYLQTPYFKTMATIIVTCICTTFMLVNVSIFIMHWYYVDALKIEALQKWPRWRKVCTTIFDGVIGMGAATVFFVLAAGIAANAQLLFTGGLKWGTEGRAKQKQEDAGRAKKKEEDDEDSLERLLRKRRSTVTAQHAKMAAAASFRNLMEKQSMQANTA